VLEYGAGDGSGMIEVAGCINKNTHVVVRYILARASRDRHHVQILHPFQHLKR